MGVVDGPGPFGLGCVSLGHSSSGGQRRSIRLVETALDLGVRCFDTADSYGSGTSERVLGRALRRRRDRAFVATKVGYVFNERTAGRRAMYSLGGAILGRSTRPVATSRSGPPGRGAYGIQDFSPPYLRAALESSLRRLETDYVDLYQLHAPPTVLGDDVLGLMRDLRSEGKILGFGVGLVGLATASDWLGRGVSSLQVPFGILDPAAGAKVIPEAAARGVPVIVRGVFASGFMANGSAQDERLMQPGQQDVRSHVRALASRIGADPMQLAAWFVTSRPGVTTVLIGTTSVAHLEESLLYVTTPPPADLATVLDELTTFVRSADAPTGQVGAP